MASPQWWPLDVVRITGEWANSPQFYFPQKGHNGLDLGCAVGTPIYAVDDGVIEFEGWGQNHSWMGAIAGICVLQRHAWGYSGDAHMSSTVVDRGQWVARGALLGYSGNTGGSTGPHDHLETLTPNPNFANGFAGRVNPATIINLQPRGTTGAGPTSPPAQVSGGLPMYATFWTGPAVATTHISGRIITDYGTFGVPTPQIMNLLQRRHDAAIKPGAPDEMLDQEAAILNNFLFSCFKSAMSGIELNSTKYIAALNEAMKELKKGIVITPESVDIDVDDLLKAMEIAAPRIARSMVEQQGKVMAAIK